MEIWIYIIFNCNVSQFQGLSQAQGLSKFIFTMSQIQGLNQTQSLTYLMCNMSQLQGLTQVNDLSGTLGL